MNEPQIITESLEAIRIDYCTGEREIVILPEYLRKAGWAEPMIDVIMCKLKRGVRAEFERFVLVRYWDDWRDKK